MAGRRKKPRDKGAENLADRYRDGEFDPDRLYEKEDESGERFSSRSKNAQQEKMVRTATLRAGDQADVADLESLPIGQVTQVYSLFCEVYFGERTYLCVVRKTLTKLADTQLVVGDRVRFREAAAKDAAIATEGTIAAKEIARPEAVIEQILPRKTVLTRADSFKGATQHPIVANADQMLIVASVKLPTVKWGLVDRMIVAARSGGLVPIICLNKMDLLDEPVPDDGSEADDETVNPMEAMSHYQSLGFPTLQTTAEQPHSLIELRKALKDRTTVLSGHSGVGKSSLIRAIQPQIDIRVGEISHYTAKGRHTTTSARRYLLDFGGTVIDTPGVKLFGLWDVSGENLLEFFPDVQNETAPPWRVKSYQRILASLRT